MKANTLIILAAIAAAVYFLMNKTGIKPVGATTNPAIPRTGNPVLIPTTTTTNNYGLSNANADRIRALSALAGSGTDLFKSLWGTPSYTEPSDAQISDYLNLGIIS